MKKSFILSCALIGLMGSSLSFGADLMQIYQDAQTNDPAFAAARAAYQAGKESVEQGRAFLLPQVSASASFSRDKIEIDYGYGPLKSNLNKKNYGVSAQQVLFNQAIFKQYEQSKVQSNLAETQFSSAKLDLINRVTQAYFEALLAEDNLTLAQAQKKAIKEQLEQAKRNFEVGLATITDTHEAQARYDLITAQEISTQNDLEIKTRALEQLIGKKVSKLSRLGAQFTLNDPSPSSLEGWFDIARKNSVYVLAKQQQLEYSTLDVERNRAGHLPTVSAVASYSYSQHPLTTIQEQSTTSLGVQISIPLFQGGYVNSKVRESLSNKERASYDLENTRRDVDQKIRTAYLGVTSGIAQVRALEQALLSSQASLDSTKMGVEVGVRTNVDLLNAQQQLYSAKRDLAQARYRYILSHVQLKAAAGTLTEKDIQDLNRFLAR